ncbi:FadR/GntR family transcriptional regulator [Streptosporangium sp. NPDC087985]|uniref:FadR/GntR family transcriptional regulator n=1 Tax=Streptosporangium sp. NPDC087985 TaxID=3366196 RepID=UPI0038130B10
MRKDASNLPFALAPIPKIDVFRAVLSQLQDVVDQLQPGDRLGSERELAEKLKVSRVSVREALRALESMGKVEIRRSAGTFVTQHRPRQPLQLPSPADVDNDYIRHLSQVREALECAVVKGVLAHPEADLRPARTVLDQAGKELNTADNHSGSLDLRFESALARQCGNPVLADLQRAVHEMWIDGWVQLGGAVNDAPRLHAEHLGILAAIEAGDVTTATRLMAEHVNPQT